jgi:hypothetical protein
VAATAALRGSWRVASNWNDGSAISLNNASEGMRSMNTSATRVNLPCRRSSSACAVGLIVLPSAPSVRNGPAFSNCPADLAMTSSTVQPVVSP